MALHPETEAITAGRPQGAGSPLNEPPALASAFRSGGRSAYARQGNPSWAALEQAIATLERGAGAVAFSSGMAASNAVVESLSPGSRVLAADSAYVELRALLADRAAAGLIGLEYADPTDASRFTAAITGHDAVWIDAVTNPRLEVVDVRRIAAAASAAGATLVVDSTLATPLGLKPLELGADLVVHSATKYIGGHSDLLLGLVAAAEPAALARIAATRERLGATPGAIEAWLALRGLRTLPIRLERGQQSAALIAARLLAHPAVGRVHYPGLCRPLHDLAGPGAMISFEVEDPGIADRVCELVEVITHAASLGGVESLIERHAHWHAEPSIPQSLLRLSVGCEHVDDLCSDLERALDSAQAERRLRTAKASPEIANRAAVSSNQRPR